MRALVLLLFGLIIGVAGAILQAQRIHIGQFWVPTGFLLALAALIPIGRAAAWWLRSRLGAIYLGIGWLIGTFAMGTSTPWGDLVLDSGIRQMAYLLCGSLLLTVAACVPLSDPMPSANKDAGTVDSAELADDANAYADPGVVGIHSAGTAGDHPND